ncbi:MAG: AI-2E family transporter [Patescibacteria group bacterium]
MKEPITQVNFNISSLTIVKVVGIFLIFGLLYLIRDVLIVVFISLILAAALNPLVNFFQSKKIPRIISISLIYIIVLGILSLVIILIVPVFINQINQIIETFPQWKGKVSEIFNTIQQSTQMENFSATSKKFLLQDWNENLSQIGQNVFFKIVDIFGGAITFISVLIIVFYLLLEVKAIKKIIRDVIPEKFHSFIIQFFSQAQNKISLWSRGQLILCLAIGILSYIGLLILGVKYALLLALIAGICECIPYLGPILGSIPAIFLAFTQSPLTALLVIILYVIIQQLENHLLVPKIMGNVVGLNPVLVIIVVLVGGKLYGPVGMLLAIPIATTLFILIKDYFEFKNNKN